MSPSDFWKNSRNVKTTIVLIVLRHHMHSLYYTNIIKQLYT